MVYGANCPRSVGSLLTAARMLQVGDCMMRGVKWLLEVGRHWSKRLSSVKGFVVPCLCVYRVAGVDLVTVFVFLISVLKWSSPATCVTRHRGYKFTDHKK